MITRKSDYKLYVAADLAAAGINRWRFSFRYKYPEKAFQRLLRKVEYLENCRRDPLGRLYLAVELYRFKQRSIRLGFTIPRHVFGPGLSIAHYGSIVVNSGARVGRNCRLHSDVNIGEVAGKAPRLGDNVYIAPGAKIYGDISIGDNVAIGANAVVNKDVPSDVSVAGVPAKVVSDRGSGGLVIDGCAIVGLD